MLFKLFFKVFDVEKMYCSRTSTEPKVLELALYSIVHTMNKTKPKLSVTLHTL